MAQIIRTQIPSDSYQSKFNEKFTSFIKSKTSLDWYSLSSSDKFLILCKVIKSCKRCDNCLSFTKILPNYNPNPKLVMICRAVTAKDIKTNQIISEEHATYSIIKKIANSFHLSIQDCYYTNTSFCGSPKVNSLTEFNFSNCFYFKELEFSTINLPKIIILLGNDAFNQFFNKNISVNSILGNAYIAEYLGEERIFLPLPHPVSILRDEVLYEDTFKTIEYYYNEVLSNGCRESSRV